MSIDESHGFARPTGVHPEHWIDTWHELEGGDDHFGVRPQVGVTLMQAEMSGLSYRNGYEMAWDDVSNENLVPELVHQARAVEMEYFEKLGVYDKVPRSHQLTTGGKIIGVRWVDVNKGDAVDVNYRSRLVGREFNVGRDDALYASTPPLEALRLIVSHAATISESGARRSIMINDVRRAYFYAKIQRDVYVELPKEDKDHGTGMLGKLRLCLYGTRDAAKGWQETLSSHLEGIGFVRGRGHPSVFWHPEKKIKTLVHGDDYVSAGEDSSMNWMEGELSKAYELQSQRLSADKGGKIEGKVLNRIIRHTPSGWEIEADPRHAELVVEQLGLVDEKGVNTPGISGTEEEDLEDDVDLEGEDITRYRGVIARCNYMAVDRPDCVFAIKEGCREMSKPTTGSLRRLRRIGRYLKMYPRLIWKYDMQVEIEELTIRTDADWAGCRRNRKSTSGGTISRGSHCIKAWSKTQAVIAKSSAESELYGVVRGACEGIGTKTLCSDLGDEVSIVLELDATAAKGILDRTGLAKVRHIDVNCLWLQEQCAKKLVPLVKIPGELNVADLMTKHLTSTVIKKHVGNLNLEFRDGRSDKAAKLHSILKGSRGGDYWAERGEHGRWVRVHVTPRKTIFSPQEAPRGPGRGTRLKSSRVTDGIDSTGRKFVTSDEWNVIGDVPSTSTPWTGKTIFHVDKVHDSRWGTDQRRQRDEIINNNYQNNNLNEDRPRLHWADLVDSDEE